MLRLIRDPLVHFLLLGGLLFLLYAWRGEPGEENDLRIEISGAEVQSVRQALALLHGRAPTDAEIAATLEPQIRDEILYREALALGLDREDSLVRDRLTEKMLFLTQDVVEPAAPTPAEVDAFYAADPARFFVPESISFEQRFFSPSAGAEDLEALAEVAVAALRAGAENVVSDNYLFDDRYDRVANEAIARAFGGDFAAALAALSVQDGWQGPLRSDFGLHAVRVVDRTDEYQPALDDIRTEVTSALVAQRRLDANEAEFMRLRDRYDVVIDLETAAEPDE